MPTPTPTPTPTDLAGFLRGVVLERRGVVGRLSVQLEEARASLALAERMLGAAGSAQSAGVALSEPGEPRRGLSIEAGDPSTFTREKGAQSDPARVRGGTDAPGTSAGALLEAQGPTLMTGCEVLQFARERSDGERWLTARQLVELVPEAEQSALQATRLITAAVRTAKRREPWISTRKRKGSRLFKVQPGSMTPPPAPRPSVERWVESGGKVEVLPAAGSPELAQLDRPVPAAHSDFPDRRRAR